MSTKLPKVSSMLQEVGILPTLAYFPFLGWKWSDIQVPIGHPLPRLTMLRLNEDMRLH